MEQIPAVREMILVQRTYVIAQMMIIDTRIENLFTEIDHAMLDPMRVQRLAEHARRLVTKRLWFEITNNTLQDYDDYLTDVELSVQNLVIAQHMNGIFAAIANQIFVYLAAHGLIVAGVAEAHGHGNVRDLLDYIDTIVSVIRGSFTNGVVINDATINSAYGAAMQQHMNNM